VHVPALRAAGFTVLALVGTDDERTTRRAKRLQIPHATTSVAEAFMIPGVDAVTIATPPHAHAALAIQACEAGRHVLCEKPFALDAAQAEAMLAAARTAGVAHLVGHEFRWSPDRAVVARAIAAGLIGEPRTFALVGFVPLVADAAARMPSWWFDTAQGGGWLGASGSHVVDQLRTWLGEVASVSAALTTVSTRTDGADDTFVVRVAMRSGAHGTLHQTAASWTPGVMGVSIVAGTHGTIEIVGDRAWCSDQAGRRALSVPPDLALPVAPIESDDPRDRFTHLELGPYTRLCGALRAGVEGRAPDSAVPVPTFADGVAEMRVLDAIRHSAARNGAVVEIP
jgi:predicted dehydrogenase